MSQSHIISVESYHIEMLKILNLCFLLILKFIVECIQAVVADLFHAVVCQSSVNVPPRSVLVAIKNIPIHGNGPHMNESFKTCSSWKMSALSWKMMQTLPALPSWKMMQTLPVLPSLK